METFLHTLTMAIYGDHATTVSQGILTSVLLFASALCFLAITIRTSIRRKTAEIAEKGGEIPEGSVPAPNAGTVALAAMVTVGMMFTMIFIVYAHDSFYKEYRHTNFVVIHDGKEIPISAMEERLRENSSAEWGEWTIISVRHRFSQP